MDTKTKTKVLILQDYKNSCGRDLGEFALVWMRTYDDLCYELEAGDNTTMEGKKIRGHVRLPDKEKLDDFINLNKISGDYITRVIDTQKEFFLLLAEIRDDLKRAG